MRLLQRANYLLFCANIALGCAYTRDPSLVRASRRQPKLARNRSIPWPKMRLLLLLAQMRSVDCITKCLGSKAENICSLGVFRILTVTSELLHSGCKTVEGIQAS